MTSLGGISGSLIQTSLSGVSNQRRRLKFRLNGFPIHYDGPGNAMMAPNLLSAHQHPEVVDQYIEKELSSGRLAGPFPSSPFPYFRVSPLGVVPKKSPGEFRLIQHLSYPSGASVNDYIPPRTY